MQSRFPPWLVPGMFGAFIFGTFSYAYFTGRFTEPETPPAPVYVDESEIPSIDCPNGDMAPMGKLYPHIIIDGAQLDYSPEINWYVHAHGGPKAYWMEFGKERMLATSDRSKNGESLLDVTREIEMEQWNPRTHTWEPAPNFSPPAIPPRPVEDAAGKTIMLRNNNGIIAITSDPPKTKPDEGPGYGTDPPISDPPGHWTGSAKRGAGGLLVPQ